MRARLRLFDGGSGERGDSRERVQSRHIGVARSGQGGGQTPI